MIPYFSLLILILWIGLGESSIITADNVLNLRGVLRLDFEEVEARGLKPGSGIFVMNADASRVVSFASDGIAPPLSTAVIWDGKTGELLKTITLESNFYDRFLTEQSLLVATQTGVTAYNLTDGSAEDVLAIEAAVEVWEHNDGTVCVETFPEMGRTSGLVMCQGWGEPLALFEDDPDMSRIGRVPPPFAVTTTENGDVFLWNMLSNQVLASANVEDVAVFGAINTEATHLAWRDPMSAELHLLDFATGEDRRVAPLSGSFISFLLLAPNADVILGIDPMDARGEVIAWNTETGDKISLGKYRPCNRQQPDLAQLSSDGSALVIGCDTGLEIWRIGR